MPRDYLLYLEDMLEALDRVQRYVDDRSFEDFAHDELRIDGVVRADAIMANVPRERVIEIDATLDAVRRALDA